jgi:hypothetical protein
MQSAFEEAPSEGVFEHLFASDRPAIVGGMSTLAPSAAPAAVPRPGTAAGHSAPPHRPHLRLVPPPARPSPAPRRRRAARARGAAALSCGLAIGFALAGAVQRPFGGGRGDLLLSVAAILVAGLAYLTARALAPAPQRRPPPAA